MNTAYNNEHGVVSVLLALSLVVLVGLAAFSVDLGYIHFKKSDLQTAADAGALAGAGSILSLGDDPAALKERTVAYARMNLDNMDKPDAAVGLDDVLLYKNGQPATADFNEVEVRVRRANERTNPIDLFFGRSLERGSVDVTLTGRARIDPTCASACVKPFIIPAKFTWNDRCEDPSSKTYNNDMLDVDSSCELDSVVTLGYSELDMGTTVTLKIGDAADTIVQSHYNPVDFPPVNKGTPVPGASMYRENIASCSGSNQVVLEIGDELQLEPGNMVGPTAQGVKDLLSQDAGAYWDEHTNSIKGSLYEEPLSSPRVGVIAFYDPKFPPVSGRTTLQVYQLGAVFIEGMSGQDVEARFIKALTRSNEVVRNDQRQCFLYSASLVRDSSQ